MFLWTDSFEAIMTCFPPPQTEEMLVEIIGENDEELLENLWDISLDMDEPGNMGFTLSFHFHPNR